VVHGDGLVAESPLRVEGRRAAGPLVDDVGLRAAEDVGRHEEHVLGGTAGRSERAVAQYALAGRQPFQREGHRGALWIDGEVTRVVA
jgi:hypothetical protein